MHHHFEISLVIRVALTSCIIKSIQIQCVANNDIELDVQTSGVPITALVCET